MYAPQNFILPDLLSMGIIFDFDCSVCDRTGWVKLVSYRMLDGFGGSSGLTVTRNFVFDSMDWSKFML